MNLFLLALEGKTRSRILGDQSFWGQNKLEIILASVAAFFILAFFVAYWINLHKQAKKTVTVGGKEVYPEKVITVTLATQSTVEIVKRDVFVAPFLSRDGYDFLGWYYDTACTVPYQNKKLTKSITLYPKWVKHG
jgi:uncharacterized repeat protein (TIGR02543 family)